ncbi:hypothetical protein D3C72_1663300 [compost metagenome]
MLQPSEMMWCMVNRRTCSASESLSSFALTSGPEARSKGRAASSRASEATSSSLASMVVTESASSGETICTGWPSCD